jgi:hypothetical protein
MKTINRGFWMLAAALVLAATPALAQFSGYFSDYYAPVNWTRYVYNNLAFQSTALVNTGNAPKGIEIDGAVDAQQQASTAQAPASAIEYTIKLSGTGLQPVTFGYLFTGLADGYDSAQLIYNGGSGFQVIASLSALMGVQQTYTGSLQGGGTFGFRVLSNNDNNADILRITAVPEPSTFALIGLGAAVLLLKRGRRQA